MSETDQAIAVESPSIPLSVDRILRLGDEPLQIRHIEEAEKRIASEVISQNLTPRRCRELCWEPLAREILSHSENLLEERAFFLHLVEESLILSERYVTSNTYFEVARYGVLHHIPFLNTPRIRAAVSVYDPFIQADRKIPLKDIERVGWDIGTGPFLRWKPEKSEAEKEREKERERLGRPKMTSIPQLLPGLGSMSASSKYPLTSLEGLTEFITHISGGSEPSPFLAKNSDKWLADNLNEMGIRLMFVHLSYSLSTGKPLIKLFSSIWSEAERRRDEVLTEGLVKVLTPFEMGSSELTVKVDKPYTVFGTGGPMGVVLDYVEGDPQTRYLPLFPVLPSTVDVPTPLHIPVPLDTGLLLSRQHINFLVTTMGLQPKEMVDVNIKLRLGIVIKAGEDLIKKGDEYLWSLARISRLPPLTTNLRINTYRYLLRRSVEQDQLEGLDPYSPGSHSGDLLDIATAALQK